MSGVWKGGYVFASRWAGRTVVGFRLVSRCRPANSRPRTVTRLARKILRKIPTRALLKIAKSNGAFAVTGMVGGVGGPALVLDRGGALTTRLCKRFGDFFPGGTIRCCMSCCSCCRPRTCLPSDSACVRGSLTVGRRVSGLQLTTASTLLSKQGSIIIISSISYVCNVKGPSSFCGGMVRVGGNGLLSEGMFLHHLISDLCIHGSVRLGHKGFHMGNSAMSVCLTCDSGLLQIVF